MTRVLNRMAALFLCAFALFQLLSRRFVVDLVLGLSLTGMTTTKKSAQSSIERC
jgi:hypothetical protein